MTGRPRKLHPITDVRAVLAAAARDGSTERVPLDRALGARLARDIRVDRDVPPFDRAAVDGFAICLPKNRPRGPLCAEEFRVVGVLAAGQSRRGRLRVEEAVHVMTGAPCPPGSDGVVMVERSERMGDGVVRLSGPFDVGQSPGIARRGEDALRGSLALPKGTLIGPPQIAVLAGVGCSQVPIYRRSRVDLWVTGDEVVAPEIKPTAAQIRNSNGPALTAMLEQSSSAHSVTSRQVKDTRAALRRALERSKGDVIVFTGGVSMGIYDLVPPTLREAGFRVRVHGVAMRPGKPFLFAVQGTGRSRRFAFGLPGNPISSFVAGWEFLLPFLRGRSGDPITTPPSEEARLVEAIVRKPGFTQFVLGRYTRDADGLSVRPVQSHGSGDYLALGRSNCLIPFPPEASRFEEGAVVEIHPLEGAVR